MLESGILCSAAWLLLAGTLARFRRDTGLTDRRAIRMLRGIALLLAIGAILTAGGTMPGERWVRAFAVASVTGALTALGLSTFPKILLRPVIAMRRIVRR